MANLPILNRASALLLSRKARNVLLKRNANTKPETPKKQYVEVSQNEANGITTISMARGPVNTLNLELATELRLALENAIDTGSKGVILTSSLPSIFSAGLDIMEMYKPDLKRCEKFWNSIQDLWLTLYGLAIPAAAAINGASPAGGCLLAMSCEYRAMIEGKHTIGLNETKLGIVAPKWFQDTMIGTIGYRQSELALLRGQLFKPEEALKIGLVDELVSSKDDAISKCEKYITDISRLPAQAVEATKLGLRKGTLAWLEGNRDLDTSVFLNYVQDPKVQKSLDVYIQALKKSK